MKITNQPLLSFNCEEDDEFDYDDVLEHFGTDFLIRKYSANKEKTFRLYAIPVSDGSATYCLYSFSSKNIIQTIINGFRNLKAGRGCTSWWKLIVEKVTFLYFNTTVKSDLLMKYSFEVIRKALFFARNFNLKSIFFFVSELHNRMG